MNTEKMTQNTIKALQEAMNLGREYGNPTVDPDHLLAALLSDPKGLIPSIFERMGVDSKGLEQQLMDAIQKKPKVAGGAQPTLSPEANRAINQAEQEAKAMGDHYTSVEHVVLGILAHNTKEGKLRLERSGI